MLSKSSEIPFCLSLNIISSFQALLKALERSKKTLLTLNPSAKDENMKIVFPLFSRLTRKIEIISSRSYVKCFSGWVRFKFGGLLDGKILRETNIQIGWQKLYEKLLSSVFDDHIRTWHSHFMFGRSSVSTRDWKTVENIYNAAFANIRGKENKEKTKNIMQK